MDLSTAMDSELRRAKRIQNFIPVFVTTQKIMNSERVAGPFTGRIINISFGGACLLMSPSVLNSCNVYNDIAYNESFFLHIQGAISPDVTEQFKLTARPVWTKSFIMDDLQAFKMGIEFLGNPDNEQMKTHIENINVK